MIHQTREDQSSTETTVDGKAVDGDAELTSLEG
jgi:hypothetical protein